MTRLVVVDVLDPLQAGLLDLARDDPALDVQAAVGDRVVDGDPLDEAGEDRRRPDQRDERDQAGVGLVVGDAGGDRDRESGDSDDEQALEVEGDDRRATRGGPRNMTCSPGASFSATAEA